jgi:hypothetical protein
MRNRLIHGYFDIDKDIVWSTVKEDLPPLAPYWKPHWHQFVRLFCRETRQQTPSFRPTFRPVAFSYYRGITGNTI